MRTLSDLIDLSIHFIHKIFVSLIFLLFLLAYNFYVIDVVGTSAEELVPLAKKNSSPKGKDKCKGKKGKDKGKGKHKGKRENSPKFECSCGHCGEWGHKQQDCRHKKPVAEVDEKETVEPPISNASSSTNRVTPPPPGLSSTGTAQSTSGKISTLMEDHAQSGWLCELVTGVDDTRDCERMSFVELLVGTGATEHVCGTSRLHTPLR